MPQNEDKGVVTISRHSDLHEVQKLCFYANTALQPLCGWASVWSHLMCRNILQFRRSSFRVAPTSAETRQIIS